MFWFKILKKIVKLLNSNISPDELALGAALGAVVGLTPLVGLHNLFIVVLMIVLNVNPAASGLSALFFGFLSLLADPLAHRIGHYLLVQNGALTPLWTSLYNMPVVPWTRFYNTIFMGSFVISLVLFVPVLVFSRKFIVYYRKNLMGRFQNMKITKMLKLTGVYKFYDKLRG
ncbi:MAG: TIGR03546 family protein [Elusimicrobia bacterium]|nr:TIGR03546 family protein [Elusimicrobiota bacterium]